MVAGHFFRLAQSLALAYASGISPYATVALIGLMQRAGWIGPLPGALGDIKGNAGETFAVQSLWSNAANAGTGYCAGAGTDSPLPSG